MQRPLEPGLIKMLRYFSGVAFIYSACSGLTAFSRWDEIFPGGAGLINLIANAGLLPTSACQFWNANLSAIADRAGRLYLGQHDQQPDACWVLADRYLYIARPGL